MKTNENNTCLSLKDNTSQLNVSVLQSPHSPGQRSLETHPRRDQRFERERKSGHRVDFFFTDSKFHHYMHSLYIIRALITLYKIY